MSSVCEFNVLPQSAVALEINAELQELKDYIHLEEDWTDLMNFLSKSGYDLMEKSRIVEDYRYLKYVYQIFVKTLE
tara:strand:+ start:329 stop:556 length:228 start_codon:yes stop_codon:yes gene_type:complete